MSQHTGSVPDTLEPAGQWIKQAACRTPGIHPDEMFPDNSEAGIAHAICRPCTVQVDCVLDALRTGDNEHGIRGGLKPAERRNLAQRRRAAKERPEESEAAAKARPVRTFQTLWEQRTVPLRDGHMAWAGSVPVPLDGGNYTPRQIAFRVDRRRPPIGPVRRTCDVDGCVLPAHLMDQTEREARRRAAEQDDTAKALA